MYRALFHFTFLFIATACMTSKSIDETLGQDINKLFAKYQTKKNTTLAILPFLDSRSGETILSRLLYSQLTQAALADGRFKVVARAELNRVLKEQSLNQTGLIKSDLYPIFLTAG